MTRSLQVKYQGQGHMKVKYFIFSIISTKYLSRSNSVEGQMSRSFQGQIPQIVHNS